jgi:serine protease Do
MIDKQEDANLQTLHPNNATKSEGSMLKKLAAIIIFVSFLLLSAIIMIGLGYYIAQKQNPSVTMDKQRETIASEGEVIADIAQKVGPSVVSILTEQKRTVNSYFGQQSVVGQAAGTGVIIDSEGIILTNKHVVPEGTSAVEIVMSDGTVYEDVVVLGRDPLNDIAILKVQNPKDFVGAKLADSDRVRTGQKVIAIGNALGQFQNTVTSGIISGVGRPVEAGNQQGGATESLTNLFQTDAAINSGNSGGPLLNYNGEVIAINTAVAENAQNIGFAIPINDTKGAISSAQKTGTVQRPILGVKFTMLTPGIAKELGIKTVSGALISEGEGSIVEGSPAQNAGLKSGDVITKVDNTDLDLSHPLNTVIGRYPVGETIKLTLLRDSKTIKLELRLAQAPDS